MSTLTEWQQQVRRDRLTASDAAAVLGLDPWKSPGDVWNEKVRELKPRGDLSDAAKLGITLESGLIDYARRELCLGQGRSNQWRTCPDGILGATLDWCTDDSEHIVEAKTSGLFNPFFDGDDWGDSGTDEVPERVLVQSLVQLACVPSAKAVHVVALLGNGAGVRIYNVVRERDDVGEALRIVHQKLRDWWDRHVLGLHEPTGTPPSLETLKRVRRTPGKTVEIDPEILVAYDEARSIAKTANDQVDQLKAALIGSLGDGERGECSAGWFKFAEENAGKKPDLTMLEQEFPKAYAACMKPTTRMMPRYKIQQEKADG